MIMSKCIKKGERRDMIIRKKKTHQVLEFTVTSMSNISYAITNVISLHKP